MSARVPVFVAPVALGAYRSAIAELPLSAEVATGPAGAIVVLDARELDGWEAAVAEVLGSGALGVVLDGAGMPHEVGVSREVRAARDAGTAREAAGLPVLVARRFLPRELVESASAVVASLGGVPHLVTVEASGSLSSGVLADALGWARVLTGGGRLEIGATSSAADAVVDAVADTAFDSATGLLVSSLSALLEADGGVPVVVTWRRGQESPWLRVSAFGATEVEVAVDDGAGCARVATRSGDGERIVRSGFEGRPGANCAWRSTGLAHPRGRTS